MDNSVPINATEQCNQCKHHIRYTATCDAFPKGIPKEILMGDIDHTKPFQGDRGIHFEKRK